MTTKRKALYSVAAAVVLTPAGIVLTFVAAHSYDLYAYVGMFLLLPSFLIQRFSRTLPIPGLTSMSALGLCVFVVVQVAYYYAIISLLALVGRRVRIRKKSGVVS